MEAQLYGTARVRIFPSRRELATAAAQDAARIIREAVASHGRARILFATGNSQLDMIDALVEMPGVPWNLVEAFHMDEYLGLPASHPASFRLWIQTRLEKRVAIGTVHYLAADAPNLEAEMCRYTTLLRVTPIDLAFVGFGENGHIAFNDPQAADFADTATVKRIVLDEASRRQQVGEGHFPSLQSVPREALTVTCPALFHAAAWVSCVPELRKARAVRDALMGPLSTACPASLVRTHPNATVYLDKDSASLLESE